MITWWLPPHNIVIWTPQLSHDQHFSDKTIIKLSQLPQHDHYSHGALSVSCGLVHTCSNTSLLSVLGLMPGNDWLSLWDHIKTKHLNYPAPGKLFGMTIGSLNDNFSYYYLPDQVTLLLVDKIVWSQALSCSHHHHHDWCEHSSISCWVTGIIVLSPAQLSQLSHCAVQSSSLPLCSSTQHMIFGHFIWKSETFEHYCCDHTFPPSLSLCLVSTTFWNSLLSLNF